MATVVKSSKNGTFRLVVEHADGRTYYSVEDDTSPYVGMFVSNPPDDNENRSVDVLVASLKIYDPDKLRKVAALMVEAADFLGEVNEIINA